MTVSPNSLERPGTEERYELRFSVTKEGYEEFESLRTELSNEEGKAFSLEAVFQKLLQRSRSATPRAVKAARTDTRRAGEVNLRTSGSSALRITVAISLSRFSRPC